MKWLAVLVKELKIYLRDRNALVQLFLVPMLVITLANYAMQKIYSSETQGVATIPVVDQDRSETSRKMLGALQQARWLRLEATYTEAGREKPMSEAYARRLIARNHSRAAAIIIPEHFEGDLLSKRRAVIRLLENPLEKLEPMIAESVLKITAGQVGVVAGRPAVSRGIGAAAEDAAAAREIVWAEPAVVVKTENALPRAVGKMNSLKQNVPGFAIMFALFSLIWGSVSIVN